MDDKIKNAVEEYQCPGCVCGGDSECYTHINNIGVACDKHVAGTVIYPIVGKIFLGMPKGFNITGNIDGMHIQIFIAFPAIGFEYDNFNIPVWKYLDKNGNTLVRGLQPRINRPFLHIFLCDCVNEIDCLQITDEFLTEID